MRLRVCSLLMVVSLLSSSLQATCYESCKKPLIAMGIITGLGVLTGFIAGVTIAEKSVPSDSSLVNADIKRGFLDLLVGFKYGAIVGTVGLILSSVGTSLVVLSWQGILCMKAAYRQQDETSEPV